MLEEGVTIGPLTVDALRSFMSRSETPMLLTDEDLRYRDVNPAACRLFGLSREELLERRIGDLTPTSDQTGLQARVEAFRNDGTLRGVVTVIGAGGVPVQVEFSAIANVVPGLALSLLEPFGSDDDLTNGASDWNADEAEGPLTPREREVLTALALGRTGAQIATELFISPETVRNHVRNARAKLGARTRAQAIARALQRGEISI
jgi:PAS domain S-box-containing protein